MRSIGSMDWKDPFRDRFARSGIATIIPANQRGMAHIKPGERRLPNPKPTAEMLEGPRGRKITTAALAGTADLSSRPPPPLRQQSPDVRGPDPNRAKPAQRSSIRSPPTKARGPTASNRPPLRRCRALPNSIGGMTWSSSATPMVGEHERLQVRITGLLERSVEAALKAAVGLPPPRKISNLTRVGALTTFCAAMR